MCGGGRGGNNIAVVTNTSLWSPKHLSEGKAHLGSMESFILSYKEIL